MVDTREEEEKVEDSEAEERGEGYLEGDPEVADLVEEKVVCSVEVDLVVVEKVQEVWAKEEEVAEIREEMEEVMVLQKEVS